MAKPYIPIYVTRQTAGDPRSGHFSLSPGLFMTVCTLVVANVIGWSIFGLVTLVEKVATSLG